MLKVKQANKRRKMYHFYQFVNDFTYWNFKKCTVKDEEGNCFKGYLYWLDEWHNDKRMDMELLHSIAKKYDNVELYKSQSQYAPEQITQVIFIGF